jgi:uncharacterized surface protein with fasciclin (FAS1) repeats
LKRLFLKASGAAAAMALLKACGGGGGDSGGEVPSGTLSLLQLLQQDSRFSTLLAAFQRAGLTDRLSQAGAGQTLFAPTNDGFNVLASRIGFGDGNGLINGLDPSLLVGLLNFHTLPQSRARGELINRPDTLYSYNGDAQSLIFVTDNGPLNLWDYSGRTNITLEQADLGASNGVLQVVSTVLVPRGVFKVSQVVRSNDQYFKEFSAAMTPAVIQEIDADGPFTLFVPLDGTNTVPLTSNVVRHHIVRGQTGAANFPPTNNSVTLTPLFGRSTTLTKREGQTRAGATVLAELSQPPLAYAAVVDVDFYGSNGVIHTIDRTLVP